MSTEKELEQHKEILQEHIKLKEMVEKLEKNREFKHIIMNLFCEKECARYAQISGDINLPVEARDASIHAAQAAGHLKRFLALTKQNGAIAERDLQTIEEQIELARQENLE